MKDVEQFKTSLGIELANYFTAQLPFFADHEIRILDFELYPWHDGQLLINFLVTGEDACEEKAAPDSEYYTPDWQFFSFNQDFDGHESEALNAVIYDFLGIDAQSVISDDDLFRLFASVVKSDRVMAAIHQYKLSSQFEIRVRDPDDQDNDYFK
ncbi:hypothetical protein VST7929_01887 [Vibrio stylophorae]|uniref:DUF2787 domain-containing protein n=1 Tax=Vibrio stylophorae TaxID=659351 RepID=A0ABN8DT52_9VIBR|nr:hypothetical protein [Vibrio stylophorae]CAH0534005.1 hypothetical protein VST7929_01887 [Vibrio stylophorae]